MKHSYHKTESSTINKEINILSTLKHPNILNFVESYDYVDYVKKNGTSYKVCAIVTELASKGDFFDYIRVLGRLPEHIARIYFKTLIEST